MSLVHRSKKRLMFGEQDLHLFMLHAFRYFAYHVRYVEQMKRR